MKLTVVQPPYFAGNTPDATIAEYLLSQLHQASPGSLILLPEYSNAGGLSDPRRELAALDRAPTMLQAAAAMAKEKGAYVAINVLRRCDGQIKNSTYLFDKRGEVAFVYNKQHLPPSEVALGVTPGEPDGKCACVCRLDGITFAFMTCYDVYFNEQIEFIAAHQPDLVLIPGYQRGERTDIIRAQAKLTAFRCNAYVVRSSYSMESDLHGGCSMIVAPDGNILADLGATVGSTSAEVDVTWKYMRPAGFGGDQVRNDQFIADGLCPQAFY